MNKFAISKRKKWWDICKYFYIKRLLKQQFIIIWVNRP